MSALSVIIHDHPPVLLLEAPTAHTPVHRRGLQTFATHHNTSQQRHISKKCPFRARSSQHIKHRNSHKLSSEPAR